MKNKDSLKYWEIISSNNPTDISVKVTPSSDYTKLDSEFLLKYISKDSDILDLATGSGLIIKNIMKYARSIVAVEKFTEFSKFIPKGKNVTIINADIVDYIPNNNFDLITMFGISQYFNQKEIIEIYRKYKKYLKTNGKLIIKNQFGINEDIIIEGYSKELKTEYYSEYRHIKKEIQIINKIGFKNIEIVDIYPPECNRWSNTHFYAIIAK